MLARHKNGPRLAPEIVPQMALGIPLAEWPDWAADLAQKRTPADTSLADTVEREIGPFGSQSFKEWYAEAAGVFERVCRCARWRPIWAVKYRY